MFLLAVCVHQGARRDAGVDAAAGGAGEQPAGAAPAASIASPPGVTSAGERRVTRCPV